MSKLFLIAVFFLVGCSSHPEPRTQRQVDCKYWLQQCHMKARNYCRSGYTVVRSVRMDRVGGPQGTYKEFKMLFTCN